MTDEVSETELYEKLLAAFREAKARGLSWDDCQAVSEEANADAFPRLETQRKAN